MNINTKFDTQNLSINENTRASQEKHIKTNFTEKISQEDAKEIRAKITQNVNEMILKSTNFQSTIVNKTDDFTTNHESFQDFLSDIGYEGKPIAQLSQSEAAELVSEDGIFGITQTSQRIANFVIHGAGGDEERFRAGREGILQGFKDAEAIWGEALPEISQKTIQATLEILDQAMHEAGFSILNQEV